MYFSIYCLFKVGMFLIVFTCDFNKHIYNQVFKATPIDCFESDAHKARQVFFSILKQKMQIADCGVKSKD